MALQSIAHIKFCHQLNNVHKFFYNSFKNKLKLLNVYLLILLSKNEIKSSLTIYKNTSVYPFVIVAILSSVK